MKRILTALLVCLLASTANATRQLPEVLVYNNTTYDMYTAPLEALFSAEKTKTFIPRPSSTACVRGYVGSWKIENHWLLLVALYDGTPHQKAIALTKVAPEWVTPVKADWFSGTLRIGSGKILSPPSMGAGETREKEIYLDVENGQVISIQHVHNTEQNKPTNTAIWKTHTNPEYNFIFKYPQNWVVEDEGYYETAGGCRADVPSLMLYEQGKEENSDDWIRINPRQFMLEDGRCFKIGNYTICTYSRDATVLAVYNGFIANFTLQPAAEKNKQVHERTRQ